MHFQILRPGTAANNKLWHARIGRVSFLSLTLGTGTMCACKLASEHGPYDAYGGKWSMYGFHSMTLCVYTCACVGVMKIRARDVIGHQKWICAFVDHVGCVLALSGRTLYHWTVAAEL
jgi:hypothetical protein